MTAPPASLPWREVIITTLVPTVLHATGRGAILPVIPVVAVDYGASLGTAGLISALLLVGGLIGDLPSGVIVSRVGERNAMIGAAVVSIAGALVAVLVPHPAALAAGVLVIGLATAVFALARHAFLTVFIPAAFRARALSTLGGTFRLGLTVGPFITAGLLGLGAPAGSAFWVLVAGCAGAALVLLLIPDPESVFGSPQTRSGNATGSGTAGLFRTIWNHRRVLAIQGTGAAVMSALRSSRQVILPLWAVSIGLDGGWTAVVIGIGMALDFALFYTGGWVMDRFGRRAVAVPTLIALSACHLGLALTPGLPGQEWWFVAVTMGLALANGLSSGILMTLGADFADERNPAPFLGAWRLSNDAGAAVAPLAIAAITAAASLPVAAFAVGAVGLVGAVFWHGTLPRPAAPDDAG